MPTVLSTTNLTHIMACNLRKGLRGNLRHKYVFRNQPRAYLNFGLIPKLNLLEAWSNFDIRDVAMTA
jgi:hypothetical protein